MECKMKKLVLALGVILVTSILYPSSGLMAQDPEDPGEYDTLYFTPGGTRPTNSDTICICPGLLPEDIIIHMNFWNDNPIAAFTVPLIDTCSGPPCNADLEELKNNTENPMPKCFEGSRVVDFGNLIGKFWYYPPNFYVGGSAFNADCVPPGDGILATLTFTVFDTGRICLDTCFWPPSMNLVFIDPQAYGYAPVFKQPNFVISYCEYSSGDPNYDGKTDIIDLVYLINYVLKHGPAPCVLKSGDVNCDDEVNIIDIIYLTNYLFKHGPAPGYCP